MRCVCCGSDSGWKLIDEWRIVPKGMSICEGCGFVSYPSLYKTEEEIKAYYRTDYRKIPKIQSLYTGLRKNHFHDVFLGPVLREMGQRTQTPVVGEIGAAYGLLLNHIRQNYFPQGSFSGTELTTTYRRVAFHEYGLELSEDFDFSKKYDLIISYKVAEHQLDIDQKLRQYCEALAPGGLLYISVPVWFDAMTNFGLPGFDLEYYYDTNHINVWTAKLFEAVLKKAGLEVIKFDDKLYDNTYLCRRNDELMKIKPEFEDSIEIEGRMKRIKEAFLAYSNQDFAAAISAYPNYPVAWTAHYEKNRDRLHKERQEVTFDDIMAEFYTPFVTACGENFETWRFLADLAMRYDKYELSLEYWQKCVNVRPGAGYVLGPITHCYRRLSELAKDPKFAASLRKKSIEITRHWIQADLESRPEAINWLYFDLSKLRLPSET